MISRLFPILRGCNSIIKLVPPAITNSEAQLFKYRDIYHIKVQNMASKSDDVSNEPSRNLDYSQLIEKKKNEKVVLIDVREHSEINETGKLPGSIHIPLNELRKALQDLSPEDFFKLYNVQKPDLDTEVIFSCRSGRRSLKALKTALDIGYKKKYEAPRPQKDFMVIFSCKAGGRSRKALAQAFSLGYANAAHYKGGWLDWEANTKQSH